MINTTEFIVALLNKVNEIIPTTYEEAATQGKFPYAVINSLVITDLSSGDLISFYIDVWTDEKKLNATEELEELCDKIRNELSGEILKVDGVFAAHIGFENQNSISDIDFDLTHRRLSFSARIFYNN